MKDIQSLVNRIQADFAAGKLKVPSLPEVALKINRYISDPNANFASMAKVIQMDPALTAKLIQVANSALYGGRGTADDCRSALVRLGMTTARNMIMSFAMQQSFQIGTAVVRDIARSTWNKSSEVAAISFVLARVTLGMVPDKALLAGLVHNIGAIPILRYAADYPEISKNRALIEELINRLSSKLGSMVLKQWSFEDEIIEIPRQINNYDYAPEQEVNYVDIAIVAHVHSQFGKGNAEEPKLHEIASFKKLPLFEIGPDASIELLYEAKEEIKTLTNMLTASS